jgi:hypothetical protein
MEPTMASLKILQAYSTHRARLMPVPAITTCQPLLSCGFVMKTLLAGIVVPVGLPAICKATDVPNGQPNQK